MKFPAVTKIYESKYPYNYGVNTIPMKVRIIKHHSGDGMIPTILLYK